MKTLLCLLIAITTYCSSASGIDLLVTVPHSTNPDPPMTTPPAWGFSAAYGANTSYIGMGSYTTTFNVVGNDSSNNVYINILANTYTQNRSNPTRISYEIKNTANNSVVTYGTFIETDLSDYTSITTSSSGNLITGSYTIKLFISGALPGENGFAIATPRWSPAIVTAITPVPEPSTIIMAIACCAVLVGVKALC
jgi:hypothetical protein